MYLDVLEVDVCCCSIKAAATDLDTHTTTMGRKGETTKFKGAKAAPSKAAKKERERKKRRDSEDEKDAERLGARARLNRSRPECPVCFQRSGDAQAAPVQPQLLPRARATMPPARQLCDLQAGAALPPAPAQLGGLLAGGAPLPLELAPGTAASTYVPFASQRRPWRAAPPPGPHLARRSVRALLSCPARQGGSLEPVRIMQCLLARRLGPENAHTG